MLVVAVARPMWYQNLLLRFGVFRSARPNDMVAAGIGRTFQNIRLFQNMTVLENVLVGHAPDAQVQPRRRTSSRSRRQRREEEAARERADASCSGSSACANVDDELAKNLPYGDQRRLELARALANDPALLLLDEPTAGMNPRETAEMTALIARLRTELGLTDPADRARHARRHGHQRPDHGPRPRRADRRGDARRGATRPARHRGLPREAGGMSEATGMTEAPAPAPLPVRAPPRRLRGRRVLLRLRGVHSYYGHIHALQGIDIDVRKGEIVTLLGTNGAGKTTTLRTISGLLHPAQGTVEFDGKDVSERAGAQARGAGRRPRPPRAGASSRA